ncbi:MAG: hypothetical protein OXE77_00745 [Flavobacteriaceae bacterium]|nr:hypothetical protein [Flavobacteriaceae bacterium]MCY4266306.1 hypothetical protein [Flavobacteriaceae bacterium]MCY4299227.1 hypothetical protein [Flavobacteriaceae bacterium]
MNLKTSLLELKEIIQENKMFMLPNHHGEPCLATITHVFHLGGVFHIHYEIEYDEPWFDENDEIQNFEEYKLQISLRQDGFIECWPEPSGILSIQHLLPENHQTETQ